MFKIIAHHLKSKIKINIDLASCVITYDIPKDNSKANYFINNISGRSYGPEIFNIQKPYKDPLTRASFEKSDITPNHKLNSLINIAEESDDNLLFPIYKLLDLKLANKFSILNPKYIHEIQQKKQSKQSHQKIDFMYKDIQIELTNKFSKYLKDLFTDPLGFYVNSNTIIRQQLLDNLNNESISTLISNLITSNCGNKIIFTPKIQQIFINDKKSFDTFLEILTNNKTSKHNDSIQLEFSKQFDIKAIAPFLLPGNKTKTKFAFQILHKKFNIIEDHSLENNSKDLILATLLSKEYFKPIFKELFDTTYSGELILKLLRTLMTKKAKIENLTSNFLNKEDFDPNLYSLKGTFNNPNLSISEEDNYQSSMSDSELPDIDELNDFDITNLQNSSYFTTNQPLNSLSHKQKISWLFSQINSEHIVITELLDILNNTAKKNLLKSIILHKKFIKAIKSMLIDNFESTLNQCNPRNTYNVNAPEIEIFTNILNLVNDKNSSREALIELIDIFKEFINKIYEDGNFTFTLANYTKRSHRYKLSPKLNELFTLLVEKSLLHNNSEIKSKISQTLEFHKTLIDSLDTDYFDNLFEQLYNSFNDSLESLSKQKKRKRSPEEINTQQSCKIAKVENSFITELNKISQNKQGFQKELFQLFQNAPIATLSSQSESKQFTTALLDQIKNLNTKQQKIFVNLAKYKILVTIENTNLTFLHLLCKHNKIKEIENFFKKIRFKTDQDVSLFKTYLYNNKLNILHPLELSIENRNNQLVTLILDSLNRYNFLKKINITAIKNILKNLQLTNQQNVNRIIIKLLKDFLTLIDK
ncbi:hypothetical protein DID75_05080 [Candidatus Marinamargulisbacteria bacterium SCGC AG-410-N11]|nr:hypothetical protein DID75_05080 [Candidatus Marinamargulisbacteria bacterium SCGC AG-410-N11]